jgi:hypothetical protein
MAHDEVLQQVYSNALNISGESEYSFGHLSDDVKNNVEHIVNRSESNKAVLSV